MNSNGMILDVHQRPDGLKWLLLSIQHVFAMFGATVLVPIWTGLDVSVALLASGIGTLIYIACTKAKVPVYLGSSFAYIGAIQIATSSFGVESAFIGLMVVGLIYALVSVIIRFAGKAWLGFVLPPVVIGPMIIIIGLSLAPVAIDQAGLTGTPAWQTLVVAAVTFIVTAIVGISGKGFFRIVPFLIGISVGYLTALVLGVVDFEPFKDAAFFMLPKVQLFGTYAIDFSAVLMFAPIAFVTIAEHIGDHSVLGGVVGRDFLKDPGLDRTLLGDGLATFVSAALGGPANTTYGENTGVVAMSKVASVWVTGGAAVIAIFLAFMGYIQAFILTIPQPVLGGISIVLFGLIASNGLKVLIRSKVDMSKTKNIIIIATMLVVGLGNASFKINEASALQGMALAVIVGVILNLLFKLLPENDVE